MADPVLERVASAIAEHGWHMIGTEGFAYTTGLTDGDHPEILIAGLPPRTAHDVVSAAVAKVRARTPLLPGSRHDGIVSAYPVEVRALPLVTPRFPRSVTTAHYRRAVPAVQLVWPDQQGRFPGEPGCAESIAAAQDSAREVPPDA